MGAPDQLRLFEIDDAVNLQQTRSALAHLSAPDVKRSAQYGTFLRKVTEVFQLSIQAGFSCDILGSEPYGRAGTSSAGTSQKMRTIEARINEVGRDLAEAFGRVLQAIPGGPHRPQKLAHQLGVNTVLTSRLLKAAQQRDPIVVAHVIPGPEPLRRLLRAAGK